jgi:DNA polymerase IV
MLGPAAGHHLHALARLRDPRRVEVGKRRRSIGSQSALGRRARSAQELDAVLVGIVDRVTRRLRAAERSGRTIILRLRFGDFTRATRSATLANATDETALVLETARGLLAEVRSLVEDSGLTLLGLSITNLDGDAALQLTLPFDRGGSGVLDHVLDDVRGRYGTKALTRAVLLGRDDPEAVPILRE